MKERKALPFNKIWNILMPFIIYYAVYMTSFFLLSCLYQIAVIKSGGETTSLLQEQKMTLTGIVNGISMMLGALVLVPMLRVELREHHRGITSYRKRNISVQNGLIRMTGMVILTIGLAVSSSIGLNILLTLTGFAQSSSSYQEVAEVQYGVAVWAGVVLYAVISPVAEEIVFRGIIYNRMRRYLSEWRPQKTGRFDTAVTIAVISSGVLFGVYHGNLVQGVYGGCMGMLMAYMYERAHAFYIPCLFHAAANCTVYLTAQNVGLHGRIFTLPWCVALFVISLIMILIVEKYNQRIHCNAGKVLNHD